MTKKTEGEEGSKTWKEKMEELISQSKKAKVTTRTLNLMEAAKLKCSSSNPTPHY